jgi:nucleoside-diphosphate-sugar epimerase
MTRPRLVITGASGFIGRHLLQGLMGHYDIVALARRSQLRCGAPFHDTISWRQVDIGQEELVNEAFEQIRKEGGADYVIHLAAHYDFTGENHPEYWRTNVDGLRHVLECCRELKLKKFVFASSVAACDYPAEGVSLDEKSPPDGEHIYAVTKGMGEAMLAEYDQWIPSAIIRFAALFSDWCEYPPLYFFLETWLSRAWNSRMLGGRGRSAIPYLHIRDIPPFVRAIIDRSDALDQREVVIASPSATLSHYELFQLSHLVERGRQRKPMFMPKILCGIGMHAMDMAGMLTGERPFERPWMAAYIDKDLRVQAARTYARLHWHPRGRLLLCRRLPFLLEHRKTDPVEWHNRNRAALKEVRLRANLQIHRLLEKHVDRIRAAYLEGLTSGPKVADLASYQAVPAETLDWRFTVIFRHLLNAVRTNEKGVFKAYCRDLGAKRLADGFEATEVCTALRHLNQVCLEALGSDPDARPVLPAARNLITMTIEFGCDQILETFEESGAEVPDDDGCEEPLASINRV